MWQVLLLNHAFPFDTVLIAETRHYEEAAAVKECYTKRSVLTFSIVEIEKKV